MKFRRKTIRKGVEILRTEWFFTLVSLPSVVTGLVLWLSQRKIVKKSEEMAAREKQREEYECMLLKSVNAALSLGKATAKAVQRIPDAHCNGDMQAALDYAQSIKHEQEEFMATKAVENIV